MAERSCIGDLPENHLGAAANRLGITRYREQRGVRGKDLFLCAIRVEPRKYSSLAAMQGIFYANKSADAAGDEQG